MGCDPAMSCLNNGYNLSVMPCKDSVDTKVSRCKVSKSEETGNLTFFLETRICPENLAIIKGAIDFYESPINLTKKPFHNSRFFQRIITSGTSIRPTTGSYPD